MIYRLPSDMLYSYILPTPVLFFDSAALYVLGEGALQIVYIFFRIFTPLVDNLFTYGFVLYAHTYMLNIL